MEMLDNLLKLCTFLVVTVLVQLFVRDTCHILYVKLKSKSEPELNLNLSFRLHTDKFSEVEAGDTLYCFKTKCFVKVRKVMDDAHRCLLSDKTILDYDHYGWDNDYVKVSADTYIKYNDQHIMLDKDHFELYYENIIKKILKISSNQDIIPQSGTTIETILDHISYIEKYDTEHLLAEVKNQSILLDKIIQAIDYPNLFFCRDRALYSIMDHQE